MNVSRCCFLLLLVAYGCWAPSPLRAQEDLSVLNGWMRFTDAENALYHHLSGQAYDLLEARARRVAGLRSKADWRRYQEQVRQRLHEIIGPFPEKTPLKARVTGTLEKDGYRVEKLVYESMPGLYVTAALFIPEGLEGGKAPAILFCSGHTAEGFRSMTYQTIILNLVRKGFVVLAFDPIGQGERLQYFDPAIGTSRVGGPTREHSYSGAQAFITGSSQARYMIWDGIRSIDYLLTREEVDPARIGVTGRSGGGTQSAYIAALDDRVLAAAPENYITSFERLLQTRGPQDAEQNFYHGIARGIDHADLLIARAPKPTLMITTTRDIFSIQGARETYAEAMRAFEALGERENLRVVEDDAPHASTRKNREAMYAFFQEALALPGDARDEHVTLLSSEELRVTETGQVATSLGGETVFSLNKAEAEHRIEKLNQSRRQLPGHLAQAVRAARTLSDYEQPKQVGNSTFAGRYRRDGYAVEQYFIEGEGDYVIPYLLMVPEGGGQHPAVIYLHPDGKAAAAAPGGEMEWFVKNGHVVLAPDLLGIGETGAGAFQGDSYIDGISYNKWFSAVLIGRSVVGVRAGDVSRVAAVLRQRKDVDDDRIYAVARAELAPVLLHAAAFDASITKVMLIEPLLSYRALVMNRFYRPALIPSTVAGALTAYDLPDLAASLAPRPLLLVNATDQHGNRAAAKVLEEDLPVVRAAYESDPGALQIRTWEPYEPMDAVFAPFLDAEQSAGRGESVRR